jgi:5-methylcytosine-specific restriction endonuclease McrA
MTLRRSIMREEPLCRLKLAGCEQFASEVDHIQPLSLGGHPTDRDNLQPVCHSCHLRKTQFDVGNTNTL